MRKQIIAGNWKMNGTIASGSILIEAFTSFLGDKDLDCDVVVCPPFTALERAVSLTRDTQVGVGAQNMDYHDAGAFTGEVFSVDVNGTRCVLCHYWPFRTP